MAKLERKTFRAFGSQAEIEDMGQFGSANATTKVQTKDIEEIMALPAWDEGWRAGAVSANNYPTLQESNGVQYAHSYQTDYILREGIAEYDSNTEYNQGSIVKVNNDGSVKLYVSVADNNTGNPITDSEYWEELALGGGGGLEVCDIGISLFVDESKGLRRYLNGTVVSINSNTQGFLNRLKQIVELHPSLACSESEWQDIARTSVGGQCGKFVIDEALGTIRLPKIIMPIQGLTDLSKLAELVPASLPNITGKFASPSGSGQTGFREGAFTVTTWNAAMGAGSTWSQQTVTFNANNSSSIYKDGATVQQEQIQYPYFIQIATGQETEVDIVNTIELNNPYSLLDSKYSDHKLNNISWLLSNNQMNSGTVYVETYNLLLKLYNGTETIEGISVKALGDSTITDYDFVIDTANTQFKLPLKSKVRPAVGNIPVTTTENINNDIFPTKALKVATIDGRGVGISGLQVSGSGIVLRADQTLGTNQTPVIFGNLVADSNLADTTGLYLYYYVGETVQNANLIDAGRIEETLATKEDIDTWVYYQNGTSGYRYNRRNGYCEQWGRMDVNGTVNLLKTYANTNYNIVTGMLAAGTGYFVVNVHIDPNPTVSSFVGRMWNNNTQGDFGSWWWKTTGYLVEGEY